ncbi:aldose epimerase family protein [Paraburkholderia phosphatilytica]|uniref:aldose epimerase family protein n=1 Tax=Paraburkholderia phosphatilytica TaxID=2282883 RepID=UPI000E526228|nr:aldose epimerase family protein [Paraburkholderia phosphatilytica]
MISPAHLSSEPWGTLPGGEPVRLYTLRNAHGMKVTVSDLGATLVSWHAPDRSGRVADILLGHDTPQGYLDATTYMGGLIGRWANRIGNARFTLDGVDYPVDRNEGPNLLHGGNAGFHRALWQVHVAGDEGGALVLRHESPEGEAGFPGNLTVQVTYTLADDGTLAIVYDALTDAPTPLNLTSHGYFNLTGDPAHDIRGHVATIDADAFLEVNEGLIPCGRADVTGSAFDFRASAPIGARLDWPHAQLTLAAGFDHCYVLRDNEAGNSAVVREVASMYDPASGRELTVFTDQRGLQFYTGNHLGGTPMRGGPGRQYAGLCLEAGGFPNQINFDAAAEREACVLRSGQRYRQETRYRVGVRD